jgi:TonB family protein
MLAALMGHAHLVPVLLDAGADPLLRDSRGLTAVEWAQRRGFLEIMDLLGAGQETTEANPEPDHQQTVTRPARLKPQELGPATMAVLKTVHASLEAQRQRAGVAAQMAPEKVESAAPNPSPVELPQVAESPASLDAQDGISERARLFSAGFKKLEAQTRGRFETTNGPEASPAADTRPLADPLLSTREFETAPLVPPASMRRTSDESPAVEPAADAYTTLWPGPVLEPPSQSPADETTVLAAEPVIPQSPPEPAPAKGSFLQAAFHETQPEVEPASQSVVRPVLWVVILFTLIGTIYLTYMVTNRLMKGVTTAVSTPASAPAPASSTVATTAKSPSKFPMTAGALVDAESELPDAEYPAKVQNEKLGGLVTVVVRVNRAGGVVISARALNGDRLLRTAAEKAAKQAKFSPGKLPDESKVVSGTITYKFGNPTIITPSTDTNSPVLGGALVGTGKNVPNADHPDGPTGKTGSGMVMVLVRVNRYGDVIAAHGLNGDSQLREAAVKAARKATFSREKLPTESRVTSGTITYYFKASQATAPVATAPTPNPTQEPPLSVPPKPGNDVPVVGGDLAGKEKNIPKAEYPAAARSKGLSGTVTILIRVNKNGKVISWRTLDGDRLLRPAALKAARQATFHPEKLGDITTILGTVTYNFQP